MQFAPPPVRVGRGHDGTLIHDVAFGPEELPPVRARDLEAGWEAAKAAQAGCARLFRFAGLDGPLDLALAYGRPGGIADAIDRIAGLGTCQGISLCLRVVALAHFLAQAPHLAPPSAAVLRAAGAGRLCPDGALDLTRTAWPARRLTFGAQA